MIVKHTKLRKKNDKALTLNKNYIVLSMYMSPNDIYPEVTIRRDEDGVPVLFSLEFFDVIQSDIPDDWCLFELSSEDKGYYSLEPKKFAGDFWDEYHDGVEKADKLFEDVYENLCKMYSFNEKKE